MRTNVSLSMKMNPNIVQKVTAVRIKLVCLVREIILTCKTCGAGFKQSAIDQNACTNISWRGRLF